MNDAVLADQVRIIQEKLRRAGWRTANAIGELITDDGILWFTATYTHGEYTVETSYRPTGAGKAEGVARVRLTPALVQAHPRVAIDLAQDLIDLGRQVHDRKGRGNDVRRYLENGDAWPGPTWKEFAV